MYHVAFGVALPHHLTLDAERLALAGCLVVRELRPVKVFSLRAGFWESKKLVYFLPIGRLQVGTGLDFWTTKAVLSLGLLHLFSYPRLGLLLPYGAEP